MVDRRPQDHPDGVPDGNTDNTLAIQAAIDAWLPGDQVVIAGGQFRSSAPLTIVTPDLELVGDGTIRALAGFAGTVMLRIEASGVVVDGDGLELDQANVITTGRSIRLATCDGVDLRGLRSRNVQQASVLIGSLVTDLLVEGLDHEGAYGVLVESNATGVADLLIRSCLFQHAGAQPGDGVEINTPQGGSSDVTVVDCTARDMTGIAVNAGIGFGASRCVRFRVKGCLAERCEGDGYHWEQRSDDGVAVSCSAIDCGPADIMHASPAGSGYAIYQSDGWRGEQLLALRCQRHGVALIATINSARPAGSVIHRASVLEPGWDGIHLTGQQGAAIERNHIRDPSRAAANIYAGIHLGRQGTVLLESRQCVATNSRVELTGATDPLAEIVVRTGSIDCDIEGVTGTGVDPEPSGAPLIAPLLPDPWRPEEPDGERWSDGTFWSDGTAWVD
jgi:hypothetical protein